jgi:AcrR family transcriptional regulator
MTDTEAAAATPVRPPGRPRSAVADEAIREAAAELFAEHGFEALCVEDVAAQAGVGKATIYRRYPSKVDLVMDVASWLCYSKRPPPPDTGHLRDDLRGYLRVLHEFLTKTTAGRMIPELVTAVRRNPELADAHRRFVAGRRAEVMDVVRKAIDRGELRRDADVEVFVDMLSGPVFYRFLVSQGPLDDSFADALVDALLRAFGPKAR